MYQREKTMHIFDYSFLKDIDIPISLAGGMVSVTSFKTKEINDKDKYPALFDEMKNIAIFESVRDSNAIEGILSTDERIKSLLNKSVKPQNKNDFNIDGYSDVLKEIHETYKTLQIDETTILRFHKEMSPINPEENFPKGAYKDRNNSIVKFYSDGYFETIWRPVPADQTQEAMNRLLAAFEVARNDYNINQLLLIPCFILDFLCIHPFSDGNGRMSRLLSVLLLYQNGYDIQKYISFEGKINQYKDRYYDALQASSEGWHENKNNYVPFMINFIDTLNQCYADLDKRFNIVGDKKLSKKERVELIIVSSGKPISKREILERAPDIAQVTVEQALYDLVKENKIKKIGKSKATKYIRS